MPNGLNPEFVIDPMTDGGRLCCLPAIDGLTREASRIECARLLNLRDGIRVLAGLPLAYSLLDRKALCFRDGEARRRSRCADLRSPGVYA